MNGVLRAEAGVALAGLLGCIAWAVTHLRKIRRVAAENEAIP